MPSARQILAARTNGRQSQGPKTPEGRRKSSANSRKHGLYGKDIPTDAACEAYRQSLLSALLAKYRPANPIELNLVETIALAGARQDWAIRASETYLAQAIEAQTNPEAAYQHPGRNTLMLLHRLENRCHRQEMRARESLVKISEMKERTHSLQAPVAHALVRAVSRLVSTLAPAESPVTPAEPPKSTNEPDPLPAKMHERTASCRPHRRNHSARRSPKHTNRRFRRRFNPAKTPLPVPGMIRWA